MNKVISFSLWGTDKKYLIGSLRNVELAKQIYPDFQCIFYVDQLVPTSIIDQLEENGAQVVQMDTIGDYRSLFWRYKPVWDFDVDICLVRDTDSRLSYREKVCVDEWLKTDKKMMTIFDHPYHQRVWGIMPGLVCFKDGAWSDLQYDIETYVMNYATDKYGTDYNMFQHHFEKKIKNDILIFDSIHPGYEGALDIPVKRNGLEFCGKVFNFDEITVVEHEIVLQRWLGKNKSETSNNL